ncbi:conserved Plasmodium protein, unknown function [Plasmodium ovale curtisi]|uniref:Nuclease associated modular domain-containing protein n=1 Tax=Plasmodium ovale curtisi TaxID=864141 RepID=A0A1A8WA87_PLAOA|nr:conserved Plasmodium protein, unknown function [Plasmodium ovale curtisi]SBS88887.1 conserved Plasmodium protein, unknown function [Plasmodium ovale curtisi]
MHFLRVCALVSQFREQGSTSKRNGHFANIRRKCYVPYQNGKDYVLVNSVNINDTNTGSTTLCINAHKEYEQSLHLFHTDSSQKVHNNGDTDQGLCSFLKKQSMVKVMQRGRTSRDVSTLEGEINKIDKSATAKSDYEPYTETGDRGVAISCGEELTVHKSNDTTTIGGDSTDGDEPSTTLKNGVESAEQFVNEHTDECTVRRADKRTNRDRRRKEEVRKKLSELAKLRWRNEEERKKLLRCKNKFKHSEKTKKLLSYKIKLKWKDETYRKSIVEKTRVFNQDENTKRRKSLVLKEKWKLKEFRDKMLRNRKPFSIERRIKLSQIIKKKWTEDEYKQKTLKAIRDNYKKRKLEVGLNPNLNYMQNVMFFRQLGISAPKIRFFPDIHKEKLRGKKKRRKKQHKENYKENWKNIYDSILDKGDLQKSLSYLNSVQNLSAQREAKGRKYEKRNKGLKSWKCKS